MIQTDGVSAAAIVCAVVALLVALVASAGAWLGRERVYQGAINAAWLGLVGTMSAIWAGQATGGASALAVAALAAVAALPAAGAMSARHRAARVGAAPALTLAVCALIWAANTTLAPEPGAEAPLLLAGQWGALGAGLTLLWCALGRGWSVAGLGLLGAAALWGNTRADVAGQGFGLALATKGGAVSFALPDAMGGAAVLGLQVAAPVAQMNGLLAGLGLMLLIGFAWGAQRQRLGLLAGVGALGALGWLLWAGFHPQLPDVEVYRTWAAALAAERKLPEQAVAQLAFQHTGQVFVRWAEVLPTLAALLGLALTALGASLPVGGEPQSDDALLARDWLLRAVSLVGLSVSAGMFVAWRQLGAWGTGAPGEWVALGVAVSGVGGLMMLWRAPDLARRVFAGLWAGLLVVAILAALASGASFAVSVRL
jgi:hypothetical protein